MNLTWEAPWERSASLRAPVGATSDTTPRDQKLGCSPPVRLRSGASGWTQPGEVEEMEDEERDNGETRKKGVAW